LEFKVIGEIYMAYRLITDGTGAFRAQQTEDHMDNISDASKWVDIGGTSYPTEESALKIIKSAQQNNLALVLRKQISVLQVMGDLP